jgi:hypothetical protein
MHCNIEGAFEPMNEINREPAPLGHSIHTRVCRSYATVRASPGGREAKKTTASDVIVPPTARRYVLNPTDISAHSVQGN